MKKIIACCGFICSDCAAYKDNIKSDDDRRRVSQLWDKYYNLKIKPDDIYCEGCLKPDSENPVRITLTCRFRSCVLKKNIDNCSSCAEYPCDALEKQMQDIDIIIKQFKTSVSKEVYKEIFKPYNNRITLGKIRNLRK